MITALHQSLEKATEYLLRQQQEDGVWRDYDMKPGQSDAWITAVVGLSLRKQPCSPMAYNPLEKALQAINRIGRADGWGYNSATPCDADCNAWCIRFISNMDYCIWPNLLQRYFSPYILPDGRVRTFPDPRFGTWAEPHQDVAPLVGLALYPLHESWCRRICDAAVAGYSEPALWHSFWWDTDSYAIAHNIELLSVTGRLTERIKSGVMHWLSRLKPPENAFETAWRLSVAAELIPPETQYGLRYAVELLSCQNQDGSWPGGAALLLPPQFRGDAGATTPVYQDQNRLMTTACAVYAVKQWLGKTGILKNPKADQ